MSSAALRPPALGTRLVLLAGFGGVLGLMFLAGYDSIRALHQIEARNTQITQEYLARHHSLDQIRSALYLSSTFVRDYLLESDPEAAKASLARLRNLREQMQSALLNYSGSLLPGEEDLLSDLSKELDDYWTGLAPIFKWGGAERQARGRQFLEGKVLPRRELVLGIADRIDRANEQALSAGDRHSVELFADFRRRVTAMLALTLGFGLIVAAVSIAHILRLERDARFRYQEIMRAQEELKKLSARLVEAQEQERRSISRELHDEVGQSLSALLVDVGNLAAITPAGNEDAQHLIGAIKTLGEQTVTVVRNMALLLRPSMLDDFGLVPALQWQGREVSRRTGLRVQVKALDVADELPEEHKTCIYRVVQEALHNASRHAAANSVHVGVRQETERIVLTIQDDGKGFDAQHVRGLGLVGMEERVKHLGGVFQVQSEPGAGTLLRVELPLASQAQRVNI